MRRVLGVAAVMVFVIAGAPDRASACSSSQPTFAEAVSGASAIARVVVEHESVYGEPDTGESYRVLATLKGTLSVLVTLTEPVTSMCQDRIGLYADEGDEVIVAFGVPYFDRPLNVVWAAIDDPLRPIAGSASVPDDVTTLDQLADAIGAALPDTALTPTRLTWPGVLGGLLFTAGVVLLGRRIPGRSDPRGG